MAVKQIGETEAGGIQHFTGLTADTTTWLAAHIDLKDGSTYRELDGNYNFYELQSGVWYIQ
jgi:hypothetical protein